MKSLFLAVLALGMTVTAAAPAEARQGCGAGFHRSPRGACISDRIVRRPIVRHHNARRHDVRGHRDHHRPHRARHHNGRHHR